MRAFSTGLVLLALGCASDARESTTAISQVPAARATAPRELGLEIDAQLLHAARTSAPLRVIDAEGRESWSCVSARDTVRLDCTARSARPHPPGRYQLALPARSVREEGPRIAIELDGREIMLLIDEREDGVDIARVRAVEGVRARDPRRTGRDGLEYVEVDLEVDPGAADRWCAWGGAMRMRDAWTDEQWRPDLRTTGCACGACGEPEPVAQGSHVSLLSEGDANRWLRGDDELLPAHPETGCAPPARTPPCDRGVCTRDVWVVRMMVRPAELPRGSPL